MLDGKCQHLNNSCGDTPHSLMYDCVLFTCVLLTVWAFLFSYLQYLFRKPVYFQTLAVTTEYFYRHISPLSTFHGPEVFLLSVILRSTVNVNEYRSVKSCK